MQTDNTDLLTALRTWQTAAAAGLKELGATLAAAQRAEKQAAKQDAKRKSKEPAQPVPSEAAERPGGAITDSLYDGMPAIAERAYRRGCTHGASFTLAAIKAGCHIHDLEDWFSKLWNWRWTWEARSWRVRDRVRPTNMPDPPHVA